MNNNVVVITSFNVMNTAEGENISYTYSEIDSTGNKVVTNERRTFVNFDKEINTKISDIKEFILNRHNSSK